MKPIKQLEVNGVSINAKTKALDLTHLNIDKQAVKQVQLALHIYKSAAYPRYIKHKVETFYGQMQSFTVTVSKHKSIIKKLKECPQDFDISKTTKEDIEYFKNKI